MKKFIFFFCIASFTFSKAQVSDFNLILKKHVNKKGKVDYQGMKSNEILLDNYLSSLNNTVPTKEWSINKEKAFWINVYNAYTIKIILMNYPINSITDIEVDGKTAWKTPFVKVGGKTYTLDDIEHEILRKKFNDPRIHVGINCASISCPKLTMVAFEEDTIEVELERLIKEFINDTSKNKISSKETSISMLFKWFKDDFTTKESLIDYLNNYSDVKVSPNNRIKYLPYNWSLNGK
ncbi:MAG: Uncharacterised protein [Flavobacterium sp. SCGC AAA160-P02]|nr:MAG: Uncharacterised protein [Flavobacterium sp. SCGC AAA160-P02]